MKKLALFRLLVVCFTFCVGCGSAPKVPKDARSQNFQVTSNYLDLGGEVYSYMDIEGDVEKAAELVNELIAAVNEIPQKYKARFDAVKIARALGMTDVQAVGMSSYALEGRYINKSFMKTAYPRTGAMQFFGGDPHPLEILQLAPKDAVIAYEYDANLAAVLESVYMVLTDILDEGELQKLNDHLDSEILPGTLTYRALAEQLKTKIMATMVVHPTRTMKIPDSDIELPYMEGFICADNMGFLMDILVEKSKALPLFSIWEDQTWQRLGVAEFLTEELLDYRPVVWRNKETQRVYIATSAPFLEERIMGRDGLETDDTFTALAAPLPIESGNSLVYVSPKVFEYIVTSVDASLAKEPKAASIRKVIDILFKQVSPGQVWMSQNTPDGIYQISNSPFSHKATLLGSMYINQFYWISALAGMVSFVAEEAFRDAFQMGRESPPLQMEEVPPDTTQPDENLQQELERQLEEELHRQYPDEPEKVPEYFKEFMERWKAEQEENKI
ncbi:MAG: hypothetical protein JXX29_12040 [Deltaproteobacteria bacterium]|nr:hypothetical protein [Deltaproteobacteria bacterium]MBN2672403.1 hypothetical protein [Deltaproteobacteria bacterium]